MAELLIMAKATQSKNPGAYKRGDVVVVMEDGHKWGREERPPTFAIVRIPGVPAEKLRDLLEPDQSEVLGADAEPIYKGRRKVRLAIAELAKQQKQDLMDGKIVELSQAQIRERMKA